MTAARQALDRLACPSALSIPVWLVAFAPSVTTAVLHDRNLFGGSVLAWLFAAVVGALAAGLVLALAAVLLGGRRPLVVLLAVFALAGALRGLGVGSSAFALGLVDDPQLGIRALSGAVLALFWLPIATVVVDGFRRHRRTREELDRVTADAEGDLARAQAELQEVRERTRLDITDQVAGVAHTLDDLPRDPADATAELQACATRLHDLASTVVRPISHEAAREAQAAPVRASVSRWVAYRAVVVDAVTVDPFRPDWLALLLFPSILMTAIRAYGPIPGILGAASIVLLAAFVLLTGRRLLTPRLHRWAASWRFVVVIGVWALAAVASALPVALSSGWEISPERSWAVFGVPLLAYVPTTCAGIAIGTAISSAWALDEDARTSRIASLTWQTRLDEQRTWATRRQWGRHLHGSVQSALTSTALLIEMHLRSGADPSAVADQARERLRPVLLASAEPPTEATVDVEEVLGGITAVWSRVASISVTLDSDSRAGLAADTAAAERVVEIVREGLSNAIRHGHAKQVTIDVATGEDGTVDVSVRDDGAWTARAGTGLGSTLLDEWCLTWERQRTDAGGTLLQCRVAVDSGSLPQPV
jgi:signal transduction histidine kinase